MKYERASGHVSLKQRSGGAQWYVKYRVNGRQVQKRLGPAWPKRGRPPEGYLTRALAEAALGEILRAADAGVPLGASSPGRTFGEACAEWLRYVEHDRQRAASTVRSYRSLVNGRLIPDFGADTSLASITTARVDEYREGLLADGQLSRRTVQQDLVLLHGIFKRAKRRKWITTNPSEDAERVTLTRTGDFNVLTVEQVELVARAAADDQEAALIRVAAYTGLRLGELRALRWQDVDFAGATLHVKRNLPTGGSEKRPKSGKVRSVPLIDRAAQPLDGLSRREHFTGDGDRVFISPTGAAFDGGEARRGLYAALGRAGLGHMRDGDDPIVFHDLRHTFGTLAVQAWPIADVQAYMGHSNIQTTMIYVHHVPKMDAAERLSQVLEAQTGVSPMCPQVSTSDTPERISENLKAP
jgi:integrase